MKLLTQSPRSSIFMKIVLTFLGVLAPLYALNLYMNESGQQTVRSEIVQSMNTKVELYVNLIESDIQRVIKLIETYVNDDDLMKLSTSTAIMSDIDRTDAILALKNKLNLVKTSSSFVHNVTAFIPELDRSVTSNDDAITAFDEAQFKALSVTTNRYETPYVIWNDRLFISVPYPDPATSGGRKPVFLLTVEVSQPALRSAMRTFTNNGETAVLSGNHLSYTVTSNNGSEEAEAAVPELVASTGSKQESEEGAMPPDRQIQKSITINGERHLVIAKSSSMLDSTLSIFVPEEEIFGSLSHYRWWMLWLTLSSIVIIVFFALSIYRIIQRPMHTLLRSFNKVEQGNLNLVVQYPLKDEFGFLFDRFNAMVRELNVLVHEVYEHKYRVRLAELRQLQSQINPHFLYNSFFILHRMAKLHDNDNIIRFTKYLGEYFQFITRDGMDEMALEMEVKYARTYTEIQAFRFGNRIHTEFGELPPGMEQLLVPRLILQPLIENAYNHGLENKLKDGWICVSFEQQHDTLVIAVEDNGDELDESKLHSLRMRLLSAEESAESTGLINVHRRIQIKYGHESGLSLSKGESGGLRAELRLPLIWEENENANVPIVDRG
ncbi:sensor histidine kinase [Paenibacillus mendelii]|uniref:Sensor histidine kinase n=1 Tax=Paenibacillus mendelii TaxID=206163 RepID=A0ABV6JHX1_9BACL|nr:histidine kinase [Paenibacillus mendelii]MCQ6558402.1 histidine kinase [Paenibacillus mendelii]